MRPRRPIPAQTSDYYYDDDEYEQDDYVEEQRYTRRRQQPQRGRTRRPTEYEDEYGKQGQQSQQQQSQGRRFADDAYDRRPQRNRNKPAAYEYDEEDEPTAVRPRNRNGNRPRNQQVDDRDRFESAPQPQRPAAGGSRKSPSQSQQQSAPRRKNSGRPKPQRFDDEDEDRADATNSDYDDRPAVSAAAQVSPTGGGSALFSRPRAAPRINRPVPLNDKRKFEYKTTSTTIAPADDGYETEYEEDYEEPAPVPVVSNSNDRTASTLYNRRPPPAAAKKKPAVVKKPPPPTYEDEEDDEEAEVPVAPTRTQYKPAASTSSRKVQTRQQASQPAIANEPRQKSRRPATSSDDQDEEPQPRPRPNRRPAVQAYSGEEDAAADDEVRAPVRNNNQRSRVPLSRPSLATAATNEGRAYSRKAPATEIYAEDDEDDQEDVQQPIITPPPPPAPARKRPAMLRPKTIVPMAAQPEENINTRRPAEENISSQNFRSQFRAREQPIRMTSTTSTTTSTTTNPPPAVTDDEEEYASDEYEDEEPIEPVPAVQTEPPRSALNKSTHRFASPVPATVPDAKPTAKQNKKYQTSGRAATISEEYFEPTASEETAAASESAAPQSRQQPVRVVKRPFLPSRGGNPYLPRGLKPLGPIERDPLAYAGEDTTSHVDLGPTLSGARLLEFHPPLVSREPISTTTTISEPANQHQPKYQQQQQQQQPLDPNRKLEEIFSSELDVTLNDALNPTLKPLSRSSPIGFSFKYSPSYYEPAASRIDATVDDASDQAQQSQIHTAAVHAPFYESAAGQSRSAPMAAASAADTEFYSDYDY